MKTASTMVPLLLLAFNATAQDHSQHQTPAPVAQDHSQHQAPVTEVQDHSQHQAESRTEPAPEPAVKSEHGRHPSAPQGTTDDQVPESKVDHAAMGHEAHAQETDHTHHTASGHESPRPQDQPITPIPELTDADRAAAIRPTGGHAMHDNAVQRFVLIDRLEAFGVDGGSGLEWEAQAWVGTDRNKLWLRSEGERVAGNLEDADLEVLYGRPVSRWWEVVAGIRHHFEPGDSQDMAVLGVTGVAPYKFEVDASLYVGNSGYTGARLEIEYETLLTNRLILQPALEVNVHGQDDRSHGNGSGLGTVEAGLRLRYELSRQFAPYIGIVHERAYGRTADFRRDDGEDINDTRIVAGVRIWF